MGFPIQIQLYNASKGNMNITELVSGSQYLLSYPCLNNDCTPYLVSLHAGYYRFECWGAEGGFYGSSWGGKGSYTQGTIFLSNSTSFYVHIGQMGAANGDYTYNGGGKGTHIGPNYGGSGGGATDIRLNEGNWNDFNSLRSRIMVAGGGGGSEYWITHIEGGHGGVLNGYNGTTYGTTSQTHPLHPSEGGKQNRGGKGSYSTERPSEWSGTDGCFGVGGSPIDYQYGAGGGGGYYGGGGGGQVNYAVASGSGGSSYVSGFQDCNSIDSKSNETWIIHTGDSSHYSGFTFIEPVIYDGQNYFSSPYFGSENGHSGCGCVKITSIHQLAEKACSCPLNYLNISLIIHYFISFYMLFIINY